MMDKDRSANYTNSPVSLTIDHNKQQHSKIKMFCVKLLLLTVFIVICYSQNYEICNKIVREQLCVKFQRKNLKNCKNQIKIEVKMDQVKIFFYKFAHPIQSQTDRQTDRLNQF